MARSTARPRSRSTPLPISTPGHTAPTSSRSRCTNRATTIPPRRASTPGITSRPSCRQLVPAPPKSTACSARLSASTRSSTPRPSPWGRCERLVRSRHGRQYREQLLGAAKRDVVAGLQFAFALPYKGYVNVAPLMYYEFANHNSFTQCNAACPGHCRAYLPCQRQRLVQADMGGRSQLLHGSRLPAGEHAVLLDQRPRRLVRTKGSTRTASGAFGPVDGSSPPADRVQLRADPADLRCHEGVHGVRNIRTSSISGSPIATGRTSSASITMPMAGVCTLGGLTGQSTNSCTESTRLCGVTVKF